MRRITVLSLILCLCLLASCLTACIQRNPPKHNDAQQVFPMESNPENTGTEDAALDQPPAVVPKEPEIDFELPEVEIPVGTDNRDSDNAQGSMPQYMEQSTNDPVGQVSPLPTQVNTVTDPNTPQGGTLQSTEPSPTPFNSATYEPGNIVTHDVQTDARGDILLPEVP